MTSPAAQRPGLGPWLHALRGTWWAVLVLFAAVPVLVVLEADSGDEGTYRATATVAAVELEPEAPGLPRIAEAVFDTADVAEDIRRAVPYGGDPRLPPDAVTVEPILDTILIRVHGADDDPEVAAALANAGADALAAELGDIGGLGRIEVTDRARAPIRTSSAAASPVVALIGLVAAAGLSLIVLLVRMSARRPVLTADDVAEAVTADWVAEIVVPRGRGVGPGLAGLGQVRIPDAATILVAGVGAPERHRTALSRALATMLAPAESVRIVLIGEHRLPVPDLPPEVSVDLAPVDQPLPMAFEQDRRIVDFDTAEALVDAFQPDDGEVFLVVVVTRGASFDQLRQVAVQTDPDIGIGAVLLRHGRRS